jgi:DHA1 family multidrug resistance protein-like MFS transporter
VTGIIQMKIISLSAAPSASLGRRVLLANTFLMAFGYFSIITVTALHFHRDLGFTVAAVGVGLALRQLAQQGMDFFGGVFADRVGYRFSIALGFTMRIVAFTGLGLARTVPQMIVSCLLAGVGGMFFDAASNGALAALTPQHERARTFTIQAALSNLGTALGAEAGIWLYARTEYLAVALLAATIFAWLAIQTMLWLPGGTGLGMSGRREKPLTFMQTVRALARQHSFILTVFLLMGFWAITAQITLTVPLAGERLAGEAGVAILLGLSTFLPAPLQYPLVRFASRYLEPMQLLALGTLLAGVGLALVFVAPDFGWQIAGIVIATLGTLPIAPTTSTIAARVASPRAIGAFFGFAALSIGLGGAIGQLAGGALFDLQHALHQYWLLPGALLLVGVGMALALFLAPEPVAVAAHDDEKEDEFAQSGVVAVTR